jgi:hypothetical protein
MAEAGARGDELQIPDRPGFNKEANGSPESEVLAAKQKPAGVTYLRSLLQTRNSLRCGQDPGDTLSG